MAKKFFKNNWTITVIGGVLSVLLIRFVDWLFIDSYLWDGIKNIFGSVVGFFNTDYTVKLYFLVLLPILFVALLFGVLYLILGGRKNNVEMHEYPDWTEYTRDVFDGIQYRWKYSFRGGESTIYDITPYCNKCSCVIVSDICPNCKNIYSWHWDTPNIKQEGEVKALIVHRIENGLYKK